mmetsp:Transcript_12316/g.22052  ORF Transcript_12316/g.22052 Transcript_12316/m.22052 type:complete len:596 (-) Transcript_12316:51-1838(-)
MAREEEGDLREHPPGVVAVSALPYEDVTNILFSSGTTGTPKVIPWTHITPFRAAIEGWAHFDLRRGERLCWPTNLGWMMGPWTIYAALFNCAAVAIYEGGPQGPSFLRFVEAARVTVLGLVPSLAAAWQRTEAVHFKGTPIFGRQSALKRFGSTGEASEPRLYHWLMSRAGEMGGDGVIKGRGVDGRGIVGGSYRPIMELCGGTELGGGFLGGSPLLPASPSLFNSVTVGSRILLLPHELDEGIEEEDDEAAKETRDGSKRAIMMDKEGKDAGRNSKRQQALLDNAIEQFGYPPAVQAPPPQRRSYAEVVKGSGRGGGRGEGYDGLGGEIEFNVAAMGELAILGPSIGMSQKLLNADHYKVYYKSMPRHPALGLPLRRHGDLFQRIQSSSLLASYSMGAMRETVQDLGFGSESMAPWLLAGRYRALGRCDDTMNLGGIKTSSVEIERAVLKGAKQLLDPPPSSPSSPLSAAASKGAAALQEVAAIGLADAGGGPENLYLIVVLDPTKIQLEQSREEGGMKLDKGEVERALLAISREAVRKNLNPLFKVTRVFVRQSLPRTASNKVMRRLLRSEIQEVLEVERKKGVQGRHVRAKM